MGGIFLLISGTEAKSLDLVPLVKKIDAAMQKESKIILRAQAEYGESHRPPAEEEQKVASTPTSPETIFIDYLSMTFGELKKGFELRGESHVRGVVISLNAGAEPKLTAVDVDVQVGTRLGDFLAPLVADGYGCNILACCGSEGFITSPKSPAFTLFDGSVYSVIAPAVLGAKKLAADCVSNGPFSPQGVHDFLVSVAGTADLPKELARDTILSRIEGDFAFVHIDPLSRQLQFCKDRFGKKSLLLHDQASRGQVCISSITFGKGEYRELLGNTLFSLPLRLPLPGVEATEGPYPASASRFRPAAIIPDAEERLKRLELVLMRAISLRATHAASTGVAAMFSGGIDSLLLAYLLHRTLPASEEYGGFVKIE